jgi:hypothetical protein
VACLPMRLGSLFAAEGWCRSRPKKNAIGQPVVVAGHRQEAQGAMATPAAKQMSNASMGSKRADAATGFSHGCWRPVRLCCSARVRKVIGRNVLTTSRALRPVESCNRTNPRVANRSPIVPRDSAQRHNEINALTESHTLTCIASVDKRCYSWPAAPWGAAK